MLLQCLCSSLLTQNLQCHQLKRQGYQSYLPDISNCYRDLLMKQGASLSEPLPSFSTRDLSQLVYSWLGSESSEYFQELEQSSGLDFQMRVMQRQTSFSVSSIASESSEKSEMCELSRANTHESLVVSASSYAQSVREESGMLVPVEPKQPTPEKKRDFEPATVQATYPSKRPRLEAWISWISLCDYS